RRHAARADVKGIKHVVHFEKVHLLQRRLRQSPQQHLRVRDCGDGKYTAKDADDPLLGHGVFAQERE
ncbi:MAG: hypothetical protein ACK55Z_36525, partial [bacterium]